MLSNCKICKTTGKIFEIDKYQAKLPQTTNFSINWAIFAFQTRIPSNWQASRQYIS